MDEIENILQKTIYSDLQQISSMALGSEEMRNAIDDLTQLYKLNNESIKLDNERNAKIAESILKERQLKEQQKDRIVKIIIDSAGIILPIAFSTVWMILGFEFEKEGTLSSDVFKTLWNRFKHVK